MSNVFYVYGNGLHARLNGVSIITLMFMFAFCNCGWAGIVVYDGVVGVEEFPDVELSYSRPIRKDGIEGPIVAASPIHACINISKPPDMNVSVNWFVLISGNSCTFETKVLNAKHAGYSVALIYTYRGRVDVHNSFHRYYSNISAVAIKTEHGLRIKYNYLYTINERFRIYIFPNNSFNIMTFLLLFSIVTGLFLIVMLAFAIIRFFQHSNSPQNGRLSSWHLRQLQTSTFQKGDQYETCAICLEDYKDHDKLRILPCYHGYHVKCIDPWLTNNRPICPVCKQKVVLGGHGTDTMDSDTDERSETAPLLQTRRVEQHGTFNSTITPMAINDGVNSQNDSTVAENIHSSSDTEAHSERERDRQYVQS